MASPQAATNAWARWQREEGVVSGTVSKQNPDGHNKMDPGNIKQPREVWTTSSHNEGTCTTPKPLTLADERQYSVAALKRAGAPQTHATNSDTLANSQHACKQTATIETI